MSSRALRRAQREREEQDHMKRLEQAGEGDTEEVESPIVHPPRKSAFAMLSAEEEEVDEDPGGLVEEDDDEDHSHEPAAAAVVKPSTKKRRKKKKGKVGVGSGPPEPAQEVEQLDEIDKALKQLSTNGNSSLRGATTAGVNPKSEESTRLLAIDTHHLHAQNEMRRLFGRAALEQEDDDQLPANANAGGNRRQQRRVQQVGLAQALRGQGAHGRGGGLAAMALKRNIFIQGKEEWPVAAGGLGMEIEEKRADGTVLYRFVHNQIYQNVQMQFEIAVETMDPNELVELLRDNPYHISTLLQVSEIAKQDRDHAVSGDLLERALFSMGRSVHSTFSRSLAEGKARLNFARPENREFWLASWRYMQNLSRRATWRTVYEWAKLLLSLSPEEDPYAIWLVLDQYALRARQDLDFLNISRNATFTEIHNKMPNVQLSQALAEFRGGNKHRGQQALFTAIGRFPWMVAKLMSELNLDQPPGIWGKEPRTEKETLYADLFATRAKDLWNTPEISALLTEVASALPPDTPSAPMDTEEIHQNEARHVLLSDTPALIALIPRRYTAALKSTSDPLPPANSYPSYLANLQGFNRPSAGQQPATPEGNLRELHGIYNFFASLFPWFRDRVSGDGGPRPTEEEIERQVHESGVSEQVITEQTWRMVQLQEQLGTAAGELNFGSNASDDESEGSSMVPELEVTGEEEEAGVENRHARAEDVEDEGD